MEMCFSNGEKRTGWFFLVLLLSVIVVVSGFNLDMVNMVKYRGPSDSMFGFSVAEHREGGTNWVLVGAPEAQSRQPGVLKGGAVYRCDTTKDECQELPFDQTGNNRNSSGYDIDQKSRQWFGATVRSSGENGAIVACAPRYVYYPRAKDEMHEPVGTCYVARESFRQFSEYSPCRTSEWGYHRQGYCQAGLGASISKDGTHLFIGAPGSRYWQGELYSVDSTVFMPFLPPERVMVNGAGQLYSQNIHQRPHVYSTGEDSASKDDSYMGYSVTSGRFNGRNESCVAVGRPRGNQLVGTVLLYTFDLYSLLNITGEQLGAYFGYALCAADVDGDGLDDLVVGAPLYTHLYNNEDTYETGRIYVFYQKGQVFQNKFKTNHTRDGKMSKGRFGLSLTGLGDINKDGFGDFAVGAPYDGPKGGGAVYIFLGSKAGVMEKHSQVIFADDIHYHMSTFGFSVSGGMDLDNNEYPDLVVGAYDSNMAILLRSRPIINMKASVAFGTEIKQISLEEFNCNLRNGVNVTCTTVNACVEYTGLGTDSRHDFMIQLILDSAKPKNPRMFFRDHEGHHSKNYTLRLNKNALNCRLFKVYVMPGIRDKLTPLEVEMWYGLNNASQSQVSIGRTRYVRHLTPVLDQVKQPVERDSINIFKNCGPDNVCIPDLKLSVIPSVNRYLLGSGERFTLDVIVDNHGEDAFEATYSMKIPLGLNYVNIERQDENKRDIPVQCSPPSIANNNTLKCDIGNPLPQHKHVQFKVLMQPFYTQGLHSQYYFLIEVNTTNPEESSTTHDNIKELRVSISIDADLDIKGASVPPDVHYNTTSFKEDPTHENEIGPPVVHIYTVRNKGPADVVEAEVFFLLPAKTLAGDNLLYLLEQPETSGPIECAHVPEANYLKLKLDRKKPYLESSVKEMKNGSESKSSSSSSSSSSWSSSSSSSSSTSSESGSRDGFVHSQSSSGSHESRRQQGGGSGGSSAKDNSYTGREISRNGSVGGYGEGERRQVGGGGGALEEDQTIRGRDYKLYGQIDEGKVLTRDEGFIAGEDAFNKNRNAFSQSSHTFSNHSSSSSHSGSHGSSEGPGSQGGAGGSRVHSSRNYSASWSENGGPVQHFSNYSSSGSDLGNENGRRRTEGSATISRLDSSSERRGYNSSSVHHSSSSSENAGAVAGSERGHDSGSSAIHQQHGSGETRGVFKHYDRSWQSENEGRQQGSSGGGRSYQHGEDIIYGSDNVDESRRSEDGQYGNLGASRVRTHNYGSSSSGDNDGRYHGSGRGQTDTSLYTSLNWDGDNVDRRQYNSAQGSNINRNQYSSSNGIGDNDREHQNINRGQYGRTESRTFHTSRDGDGVGGNNERGIERDHYGGNEGYTVNTHHYSNLDGIDEDRSQRHGSRSGYLETSQYNSESGHWNSGRGGGRDNSQQHRSSNWSGGNVDLGYAALGPQGNFRTSTIDLGSAGSSRNSWSSSSQGSEHHITHSKDLEGDRSGKLNLYERYRREAEKTLEDLLQCNTVKCTMISCVMGPLAKNKEVQVAFRSRVWVPTLKKISADRIVKVSSVMALQVTDLPYIGSPDNTILRNHEVYTDIVSTDSPAKPDIVPLWIVVVSAVAGALILLLIIFLLWKSGFFKRNRPSDAAEKEPLNRNGHYSTGDEAL